jgi:hypothetical protein
MVEVKIMKKKYLIIKITAFKVGLDLRIMFKNLLAELKKNFKFLNIRAYNDKLYLEVELSKDLKKILKVIDYRYPSLITIGLIIKEKEIDDFVEEYDEKFSHILISQSIEPDISYAKRDADKFDKVSSDTSTLSFNGERPIKKRIKDFLWVKYGVDDILTEKAIEKLTNSFNEKNVEVQWLKPEDSVGSTHRELSQIIRL